jgi:carbon-monoxide dehydrogenase large subunit
MSRPLNPNGSNGAAAAGTNKWLGARVPRVEDRRFLTGEAKYVGDLVLPRMVHAVFVRSTVAHARLGAVDVSAAAAHPGVLAVLTASDFPELPPLVDQVPLEGLLKTPQPVLAAGKVRFVGEAVAVVVASDRYVAEDAAEMVVVDYEPLPPVVDVDQALADGAPLLFEELGTNVMYRGGQRLGDPDAAFADADLVVETRCHTNRHMAAPMEGRGTIAQYERASDRLTCWTASQTPHWQRMVLSAYLGIPEQRVRVVTPDVGGGFGQKITASPEEIVVAALARRLRRPVKWIEDRRESLTSATHAKENVLHLKAAVRRDGRLLGLRATAIGDAGAYSFNTTSVLIEPLPACTLMPGVYHLDNYEYEVVGVVTNKTPIAAYRGVGWTAGHTAREQLFDEIARQLEMDPADFRRKNMIRSEELPFRTCTGSLYDSGDYVGALDLALETLDYKALRERQEEMRRAGRYLGIGLSPFVELTGFGSDASAQCGLPLPTHDNAKVTLEPSGKVTVAVGVHSHGQGHETSLAQIAAETLGVGMDDVSILYGDTSTTPFGVGTWASRSAVIGGGAIRLAAEDVRGKVLAMAAHLLEANPEDVTIDDGSVFVVGTPAKAIPLADVAMAAYFAPMMRPPEFGEPFLSSTRNYDPPTAYANGCVAAVVEVDAETGEARLERVVMVEDCGTMINPMIIEGQAYGAVTQAIGGALLEHLAYDENGQPLATTYMDYLVPTSAEVPPIEVLHMSSPSPHTVLGIKGMGEGGAIAGPAAVVNAVVDALAPFGADGTKLPMSLERISELLRAHAGRAGAASA